ncbi:MAG: metal-dependent hydrolase [Ruminococcaceae bacterium]|nr:metal-dependent hydrolase [Oscillospiraceae bacterium]
MIIDFHTHIFPDKIAQKTIDLLSKKGGIPPFSNGSVDGLLSEMKKGAADLAITLPVLTSPSQFDSVNRFATEINRTFANQPRRLISFAGIHPKCERIEEKMAWIAANGFLGVKLHPDYQETFIDDAGYVQILTAAKRHGLIVVTHAGVDGAYRGLPVRCPPSRAKRLIEAVPYSKLVLAHYGANEMLEEVVKTLCGLDVYFDTAYILRFITPQLFREILQKHGEDRVLFATDSPWSSIERDVEILRSFALGKKTEDKLFFQNAKRLLGMR